MLSAFFHFSALNNGQTYDESLLIITLYTIFRVITGTIGIAWAATTTAMLKDILESNINKIWFCSKSGEKSDSDDQDKDNILNGRG